MLEMLKAKNPGLKLFSVTSPEFAKYGRVITNYQTDDIEAAANAIEMPKEGASYTPSVEGFEVLPIAQQIKNDIFGCLPTQIGFCWGYSNCLNALEWHCCSELNIAITPLVLMFAGRWDVVDNKIDASSVVAFYLPQGTVVEVFASTLHYCPCEVSADGFRFIVGLLEGTNVPHSSKYPDPLMTHQNKWLLAHNDNADLIAGGAVPGISGENYRLNY